MQWIYKLSSSAGIAIQPCAESNLYSYSAWQTPSNRTSISILMLLPRDNHRSWAALKKVPWSVDVSDVSDVLIHSWETARDSFHCQKPIESIED